MKCYPVDYLLELDEFLDSVYSIFIPRRLGKDGAVLPVDWYTLEKRWTGAYRQR